MKRNTVAGLAGCLDDSDASVLRGLGHLGRARATVTTIAR
jgi:hypothetical protein